MILDFYFARRFLRSFFGLLTVLFIFTALLDMVEQMRKLSTVDVPLPRILGLVMLNVPKGLYDILPLVMILGSIGLFMGLSRSSELVVTRASGRATLRTLLSPVVMAFLLGVLCVTMLNPIVAATSKRYVDLFETYRSGGADSFSVSAEGLWLRQGGADGQTVIRAARANPQATELYDVTMITYGPERGGPTRRIEAATAQLIRGAWALEEVKIWPLDDGINPEAGARRLAAYSLPSSLTEESIRDSFGDPSAIPIWELPAYIRDLGEAGFSARRHAVWFQMELARPIFLVAMVLLAAAFNMRHARSGKTGQSVLATILLGFTLYYIRNFAQVLGESGQIPVMLAAWAPPVASVLLALGLVLQMEGS